MINTLSKHLKAESLDSNKVSNSVVIFHPGHVLVCYNHALALQQAGMLSSFETGFYFKLPSFLSVLLSKLPSNIAKRMHKEFMRRRHDGLSIEKIKTHSLIETMYLLTARLSFLNRFSYSVMRLRNKLLANRAGLNALKSNPNVLIGYDSCFLEAFLMVKKSGITCVLDQIVGSWSAGKKILDLER